VEVWPARLATLGDALDALVLGRLPGGRGGSLLRVAPSGRRPTCRCWTHSRSSMRKTKRYAKRPSRTLARTSGGQTFRQTLRASRRSRWTWRYHTVFHYLNETARNSAVIALSCRRPRLTSRSVQCCRHTRTLWRIRCAPRCELGSHGSALPPPGTGPAA
jgi:hypothetical protein